jgi:hypothetical protein
VLSPLVGDPGACCGQRRGDWVGQTSRRRRPSSCAGEKEDTAQQPGLNGGQHAAPVGLSLRERAGWFQPGQLLSMRLGLGQPGGRSGGEGRGDVELEDVNEPGGAEQPIVVAAHGHRPGPSSPGPAASRRQQPRRFNDGVEADATTGPQESSAGSQHGELGPQSTQHVGVDDGVEAVGPERQPAGRGGDHVRTGGESFAGGAVGGH